MDALRVGNLEDYYRNIKERNFQITASIVKLVISTFDKKKNTPLRNSKFIPRSVHLFIFLKTRKLLLLQAIFVNSGQGNWY